MLTYNMNERGSFGLYEHLYRCIRADIESGVIAPDERLPSKRPFAQHLGVSLITVEGAYAQLLAEGYIYSRERRGYYAAHLPDRVRDRGNASAAGMRASAPRTTQERFLEAPVHFDFGDGRLGDCEATANLWGRAVKAALNEEPASELFADLPAAGHPRLRQAIAGHLRAFRGMDVSPQRIVVGAGAQLFYVLLAQMLGPGACMAVEDPGFARVAKSYAASGLDVRHLPMDAWGIDVTALAESGATAVHVMPSHQFPTGAVMSAPRRYELLSWAAEDPARLVVEDDYDCEFRLQGRPIPALASVDALGQVAYLNTFSKSLSSALRMAYLVLPPALAQRFEDGFSFYVGTVSALDQIALARLIKSGEYERHINRVRTRHRVLRDVLLGELSCSSLASRLRFHEVDSGLHFVLEVESGKPAHALAERALQHGVRLVPLQDYCLDSGNLPADANPRFVMQYGSFSLEDIPRAAACLSEVLSG